MFAIRRNNIVRLRSEDNEYTFNLKHKGGCEELIGTVGKNAFDLLSMYDNCIVDCETLETQET